MGYYVIRLREAFLVNEIPTRWVRLSLKDFPEYKGVTPSLVWNSPELFHHVPHNPRISRLYRFISLVTWPSVIGSDVV